MTGGHKELKEGNSLIFPCFSSLAIFLAHTVVCINFSFSIERNDISFVINQIINFTQKCRVEMLGILLCFYDQSNLMVFLAYCVMLLKSRVDVWKT